MQNNNEICLTLNMAENNWRFSLYDVDEAMGKIHIQTLSIKMNCCDLLKGNLATSMKIKAGVLSPTAVHFSYVYTSIYTKAW